MNMNENRFDLCPRMEATFKQLYDALNATGRKWHAEMSGVLLTEFVEEDRVVLLTYLPDFCDELGWKIEHHPLSWWHDVRADPMALPLLEYRLPGVDCREMDDAARTALVAWANEMVMKR